MLTCCCSASPNVFTRRYQNDPYIHESLDFQKTAVSRTTYHIISPTIIFNIHYMRTFCEENGLWSIRMDCCGRRTRARFDIAPNCTCCSRLQCHICSARILATEPSLSMTVAAQGYTARNKTNCRLYYLVHTHQDYILLMYT